MLEKMLNKRNLSYGDIVEVQSILNEKADPKNPDWKSARTTEDFKLASVLEMAELVESTPWKWWKGGSADLWNVKIELIDMLHFLTSNVALHNSLEEDCKDKVLGFTAEEVATKELFNNNNENEGTNRLNSFNIIKSVVNENENYELINYIVRSGGLEAREISAIYIAKYTLNEIRWKGGYALNQYKKMKSGFVDENGNQVEAVEDNVFLKSLVDSFKENENMTLGDLRDSVFNTLDNL